VLVYHRKSRGQGVHTSFCSFCKSKPDTLSSGIFYIMKARIKYHDKELPKLKQAHDGEWFDMFAAENCQIRYGETHMISLGVSIELPDGYEAIVAPRSSTHKHFGIMCVNGIGVIDNAYKGDNDVWHFPAIGCKGYYDMLGYFHPETSIIHKGDRICQMRIQKCQPSVEFDEVDFLGNADRNGLGSTGRR